MTKLRGAVEPIIYQNPENGWSVLKVKDYMDLVTLTGSLFWMFPSGACCSARGSGKWTLVTVSSLSLNRGRRSSPSAISSASA